MGSYVKRSVELYLLTKQYNEPGNSLVILYGRRDNGKTLLLKKFMSGKPSYYYCGTDCAGHLQLSLMKENWSDSIREQEDIDGYSRLFSFLSRRQEGKAVIVLDEFHLISRNSQDFYDELRQFLNFHNPVMVVLCSSSIRYVEYEMMESMGSLTSLLTSYIKLKEFSFLELISCLSKSSVETCIYAYSILGGIPGYLRQWREDLTVKDNVINILLNKDGKLFMEPQELLKQELRELPVYNSILSSIASGNWKLNSLHKATGYSRAKIMVYLKALIQLDIVEKLVPLGEEGKDNARKGLYRIKDRFICFWYRFVYPKLSLLQLGKASQIYDEYIAPHLSNYMEESFADVCLECLKLMSLKKQLPSEYVWWDRWYGKNGTLHIVGREPSGKVIAGRCIWEDGPAGIQELEILTRLSKEAGINPELYYLFSGSGFTVELSQKAKEGNFVRLVSLEEL